MDHVYDVTAEGVYINDDSGRHRVCDRPLEVVSYSSLDREYYLSWPSDHNYNLMAAIPGDVVEQERSEDLTQRLRDLGFEVEKEHAGEITTFIRRRAQSVRT